MEESKSFINITNIIDNEMYIEDETFEQKENTDENSLKSMSWIELVENELTINDKQFATSTNFIKKKHENVNLNVDCLITENYNSLSDINIIEYQTMIINHLKKMIKLNNFNIDDILLKIEWLLETSKYLSDKLGLSVFQHKNSDYNFIPRSSYKFCNYNFQCQYNYNIKKHCGCFAQHYVHNLVYADIDSLKKFILENKSKIDNHRIEEIRKSINTVSFVINHMFEEFKNAQSHNFFNIDNIHVDRTPKKKKIKIKTN